jgi:L-methionine (R)-S-oxide reductase
MKYETLLKQIISLTEIENNLVANLSNSIALLHENLETLWTGIYFVDEEANQLVLGPFQGPVACTRIPFGKGVCGDSWKEKKEICVEDVHKYPGHIACSTLSRSEIVIPLFKNRSVVAVLDIDSEQLNYFQETDIQGLKSICSYIESLF